MWHGLSIVVLVAGGGGLSGPSDLSASPSVVSIHAAFASGDSVRHVTGFLLEGQDGIVTALHGVVDGTEITAEGVASGGIPIALTGLRIEFADVAHDVAVLRVRDHQRAKFGQLTPLIRSKTDPSKQDPVHVIGYPQGMAAQLTKKLVRVDRYETLSRLFPADMSRERKDAFRSRGSPGPSCHVLALEGLLEQGLSGAPLVNEREELIGLIVMGIPGTTTTTAITWATVSLEPRGAIERTLAQLAELSPDIFSYSAPADRRAPGAGRLSIGLLAELAERGMTDTNDTFASPFGAFVRAYLSTRLGLEIQYHHVRWSADGGLYIPGTDERTGQYSASFSYNEYALLLDLTSSRSRKWRLRAYSGPSFSLRSSAEFETHQESSGIVARGELPTRDRFAGVVTGVGVEYGGFGHSSPLVTFDLRILLGTDDLMREFYIPETHTILEFQKTTSVGLQIGLGI